MATAGSIVVDLLAKTGSFETDLDRASKRVSGFGKSVDDVSKTLTRVGAGLATFAVAGASAMAALTVQVAATAREIQNLSQLSGTSAADFQKQAYAARTVGIEQQKLADIYKDMRDRVGDFLQTGGGPLADFFENIAPKVGVTIEQFRALSGPEALGLFVASLEKANLSQNEMTFYMEAIASDSSALLPLLKNNAAAFRTLGDEAQRLGLVMDEATVQAGVRMEQSLERLKTMVSALSISVANEFLPTLNTFVDNILKATTETGGLSDEVTKLAKDTALKSFLQDSLVGLSRVADVAVLAAKSVGVTGSAFVAAKADVEAFLAFVGRPDALSKAIAPEESARLEAEYQAAQQARIDATETFNKRLDDLLGYQGDRFEQAALQAIKTQQETAAAIKVASDSVKTIDLTAGPTEAQLKALAQWMEKLATPGERLASTLAKAKAELGELYTPEIEARIKAMHSQMSKGQSDAAKALQRTEQERQAYLRSQYQEISNLDEQVRGMNQQIKLYGLAESAVYDLTIAELEAEKAALSKIDAGAEEIAILERKIELNKQLRGGAQTLETLDAEKAAWESWAGQVDSIFQRVGQSLTDAIFEGGKSGRELLKDIFKALTFNVLINPVMGALQGGITNSLGGMFGFQNPAERDAGGGAGGISGLSSLTSLVTGNSMGMGISNALTSLSTSSALAGTGVGNYLMGTAGNVAGMSNLALGGAGILGGLGAGLIFDNKGYSSMGGSLGATAGMVFGGPIGAIAGGLIGGGLGSLFGDDKPRTRQGQRTTIDYAGGNFGISAIDDRQAPGSEQAALAAAQAAVAQANEIFARLGMDAAIESFYAVMESSVLGDRQGVASGGMLRTGDQMRQIGIPQASDMTFAGFGGWSEADMLPRLQTDIQLSILEAFQAQIDSLPTVLGDMIRGVDVRALDAAGAQDLAARFSAVVEGASNFLAMVETMPFEHLRDLSFDAAAGLVQLAGGVESLMGIEQDYYQNFYTDAERQQHAIDNIAKSLSGVGVEMPAITGSTEQMLAAFRALRESQDLNTEAGRAAYVALGQVSGAFADVARSAEQAAQEQRRIAVERRQSVLDDLTGAYNNLVSVGQAEIARLQQSFGTTDSAMERYRSAVQALESEFGALFSSIDRYVSDLRGSVEASAAAQYRQARAIISTAVTTRQLPQTADLNEALQVAQAGVMGQNYASLFEQERAYSKLANEMQALQSIAEPELDAALATLAQLEDQYALLRGTAQTGEDSLDALGRSIRVAIAQEEAARQQISLVEQQLETAREQYNELMGINDSIADLAAAVREFAAAAATAKTVVSGGGGGGSSTGGWTPGNLPTGAENLSAAERYVLYNEDLLVDYSGSGMTVDQYANFHWNTYGKYEDRDIGLNSYAVGTGYVPYDMTANIHQGEMVIDPHSSDVLRKYGISVSARGASQAEKIASKQVLDLLETLLITAQRGTISANRTARMLDDLTQGADRLRVEVVTA